MISRQACAIESAALLNPNLDVFVLFASPVGLLNDTDKTSPIIIALQSYPNIFFRNINLWTYSVDTPLEDWFLSDALFQSQYLNSHVSDYLRYLSLYKFGGTYLGNPTKKIYHISKWLTHTIHQSNLYLDLDVVVQKTFENISANYAGAESQNFVAAGVINFDHDGIGHEIADMCVR